jgi:hypothetical protein
VSDVNGLLAQQTWNAAYYGAAKARSTDETPQEIADEAVARWELISASVEAEHDS